jgi:hypothetical protein
MGKRFPLKLVVRPSLGSSTYLFLGTTVFLVLPIWYAHDKGIAIQSEWLLMLFIGIGALCLFGGLRCLFSYVKYEITAKEACVEVGEWLRRTCEREPLSAYSALLTPVSRTPAFIGEKDLYLILLWHNQHSIKQITLFSSSNKKKFDQRLSDYQSLFKLPVNPPELEIAEVSDQVFGSLMKLETEKKRQEKES